MRKVPLRGLLSLIAVTLLASLAVQAENWSFTGSMQQTRLCFSNTAGLNTPRQGHASALLTNGQVLAAGGYESQLGNRLGDLASAELFH